MVEVVKDLKPLPGAKEFLDWLKPLVPRILLLTDGGNMWKPNPVVLPPTDSLQKKFTCRFAKDSAPGYF